MDSRPKIKLPVPYKPPQSVTNELSNVHNKLTQLHKMGTEKIMTFIGSPEVGAMFYLYLLKKYKSTCFFHNVKAPNNMLEVSIFISKNYQKEAKQEIEIRLSDAADMLVNCIKKDTNIIIIPISLTLHGMGMHANALI